MSSLHDKIEQNLGLMVILVILTISVGGLVQITPLFFMASTTEAVEGLKPYTPLQLIGRDVYVREGCYLCHSQMIRPFRAETERYGHYSLAGEYVYDHPFQWGSKRTGPDLARVGGRYSDEWHVQHLIDPQSVVPDSIMPSYAFLGTTPLNTKDIAAHLKANRTVGVPYSDAMIENAEADMRVQANPDGDTDGLEERYQKISIRNFDGDAKNLTEMDALVAYLQMLGTLVDLEAYKQNENLR